MSRMKSRDFWKIHEKRTPMKTGPCTIQAAHMPWHGQGAGTHEKPQTLYIYIYIYYYTEKATSEISSSSFQNLEYMLIQDRKCEKCTQITFLLLEIEA